MQPRRDYDEYTKFINDTFAQEKEQCVLGTLDHMNKTGSFVGTRHNNNPVHTLKTNSEKDLSLMNRQRNHSMINPVCADPEK